MFQVMIDRFVLCKDLKFRHAGFVNGAMFSRFELDLILTTFASKGIDISRLTLINC